MSNLSAPVLGKLLLMQSLLDSLPDEAAMRSFVCRGFSDLPGVAEAEWRAESGPIVDGSFACFLLLAGNFRKGELLLRLADRAAFLPYEPYVRNFCFMLAVLMEARQQRLLNLAYQAELEKRVEERTAELVSRMDESANVRRALLDTVEDQTQSETALRQSETRFRTLVENIPQKVFLKGRDFRWLMVNENFARDLGLRPEEVVGKVDYDFFPKELADKYRAADERVMHSGRSEEMEEQYIQEGRETWVNTVKTPVRDERGEVIGVFGIFWDITESRRAEAALREREERLRLAMGAANMGTWDRDLTTNALHWSDTEERLMGYAPGTFPGTDEAFVELIHPDSVPAHMAAQQRVRTGDGVFYAELRFRCKGGRERWGLLCGKKILDETGRAIRIVGVDMDITERKLIEDSHARLATAVEQADETILITDTHGTILYVNPAFEKSTGYTLAEALGRNPRMLRSGKHDTAFYRKMWETLVQGEVWSGHFVNRRKDGKLYEEEATISPIRNASGEVVNYVAVKRDVTREVQLEAQFRQSQKMESIGQLAGGIAHDFNNILAVLMMQTDMAAMVENTPEEVREGLREISAATVRAANLTRQLLLFSRQEVMQPRPLDLNEVVTSLAKMLQRLIRENVHLQLHLHSAPLPTYADGGMLDQLLMNLAVNARDAMPKGGRLIIETAEKIITADEAGANPELLPGRFVWLSVSDTGCGMTPEIQSRIFEPFFTTKEVGHGTGLGLATVFGIVKQHRGWIKVYSEVGKGTTFQVFLPASEVSAQEALAGGKAKPKPRGGSETILVVEDNEAVRILTRRMLERSGYEVLEADDGVTAQQVWNKHRSRIALLLTDLVMPGGLDGRELAALLQLENPALKIILTSGYSADIAGRELVLKAGQNFLQKPCPPDQLLTAVRNCLDS